MKSKKMLTVVLSLLVGALLVQTGAAIIFADETDPAPREISAEALEAIREADPGRYEERVQDFRNLLVDLDVHSKFQSEIERLVIEGYPVQHVLIAYAFLYDRYGAASELEQLVARKAEGAAWRTIFADYDSSHEPFAPRSFDSSTLERLLSTPGIQADDIMIADRVSHATGKPIDALFAAMAEQPIDWKETNADLGILNSASTLPRVQVTAEQMAKFTDTYGLTEAEAMEAFVLAHKTGRPVDAIAAWFGEGLTEHVMLERIYEEVYA